MKSLWIAVKETLLKATALLGVVLFTVAVAGAAGGTSREQTSISSASPVVLGAGQVPLSGTTLPVQAGAIPAGGAVTTGVAPGATPSSTTPRDMPNVSSGTAPATGLPAFLPPDQSIAKPADLLVPKPDATRMPQSSGTPPPDERSTIEQALTQEVVTVEKPKPQTFELSAITQFGYGFFRPDVSGFAAMTDVPVGPDYMLGVGDRIVLTLWGSIDGVYELEVSRQGEVVLPRVGSVNLVGTPFGRLPEVLRAHLAKVFRDFELNVNIGKLRSMKVYVVGDVHQPGDYTISSLSTVLNALSAAGGPTKDGSLRNIQIKRNGQTVETVDLYDFFLKGDKSRDIRLQPGDTIFVPPIGPVAGIAGNVRRAAIFELKGEKNLKDLLVLADGIKPGAYLQRLQIYRLEANKRNIVTDTNLDPVLNGRNFDDMARDIAVQDMDMVKVFPIDATLRGYARLSGYVLRPGDYALKPNMRLKDLIGNDNLLPESNIALAEVTRLIPPDLHPEKVFVDLQKVLAGDENENLLVQEFDELRIFPRWEMEEMPRVRISGDVQKPGDFRLFENMTVRDLLLLAGNPKRTAYLKSAEISRIKQSGGAVTSFSIIVNLEESIKGVPEQNIKLEPFDELIVRKIPNWAEETDRYVTLKGEFLFPGTYPIYKGERLSSVIRRAGGFTDKAYLKSARFIRKPVQELQQKRMGEILARTEVDIQQKQAELASTAASKEELEATKAALAGMMQTVATLKNAKAEGRVVITLLPLEQLTGSENDIELVGGDQLEVRTDPRIVNVLGEVYNQTSFLFMPSAPIGVYLSKAGGFTRVAEDSDIYVVKIDGSVVSRQHSDGFLFFDQFMYKRLDSGDTIVVPQRLEKIAWLRDLKDIATILGQLAITAGVIVAAGL